MLQELITGTGAVFTPEYLHIALAFIVAGIGQAKGSSGLVWFLLYLIVGDLALIMVVVMPIKLIERHADKLANYLLIKMGVKKDEQRN